MELNKPITTIILLIINLMLIFLFVIPKYHESNDLQKDLMGIQAKYDSDSEYKVKLLQTLKEIEDRKESLEKIDNALPSNFSISRILSFFKEKSTENKLTVRSITFREALSEKSENQEGGQVVKGIDFTVSLTGGYQGLKNLLSSIDRSDRLLSVNSISFSRAGSSLEFTQEFDFKLEMKTYSY